MWYSSACVYMYVGIAMWYGSTVFQLYGKRGQLDNFFLQVHVRAVNSTELTKIAGFPLSFINYEYLSPYLKR